MFSGEWNLDVTSLRWRKKTSYLCKKSKQFRLYKLAGLSIIFSGRSKDISESKVIDLFVYKKTELKQLLANSVQGGSK